MKIILSTIFIFSLFFISCEDSALENEKFLNTYKEILIARESIADSLEANKKVDEILKENGYTEKSFREEFFEIASDNEDMVRTIDSLRTRIGRKADSLNFVE